MSGSVRVSQRKDNDHDKCRRTAAVEKWQGLPNFPLRNALDTFGLLVMKLQQQLHASSRNTYVLFTSNTSEMLLQNNAHMQAATLRNHTGSMVKRHLLMLQLKRPSASLSHLLLAQVDPALIGTRNILSAVVKSKDTVRRVVLTSSCAGAVSIKCQRWRIQSPICCRGLCQACLPARIVPVLRTTC